MMNFDGEFLGFANCREVPNCGANLIVFFCKNKLIALGPSCHGLTQAKSL
jgi:hypothetical protein